MLPQKQGRLKKDKSVSMGTLSMKIFKAAILPLLNDFISFLINPYLSPHGSIMALRRPETDIYSGQSRECKTQGATCTRQEYHSGEESIISVKLVPFHCSNIIKTKM